MPHITHKRRIIELLRRNPTVCATTFHRLYMPTARNRIAELNKKEGWVIVTERWCDDPYHRHETRQVRYRLVSEGPS